MSIIERRAEFEATRRVYASAKVRFGGAAGYDVYNPSAPFTWGGGRYIFGRVERRGEWARSWVRLFAAAGEDAWEVVPDSMVWQLEDPYVTRIGAALVMGGTHVRYSGGRLETYYAYFYRGTDLHDLYYFTTGPNYMKDIRLVPLADGRIGVFSRPRSEEVRRQHGSESLIGFTIIGSLEELTAAVIENAPIIPGLFARDEWGGCNQAFALDSGLIGVIGHMAYKSVDATGQECLSYVNAAFAFDPVRHEAGPVRIIGTRPCYPEGPRKRPELGDVAFTAGIAMRADGKADLYSGIGDCEVGRIVIDYPFAGAGRIVGADATA